MHTEQMTRVALMTALLAATAPLSIPLASEVPLSLATLMVMLAGVLLGPKDGAACVVFYLLLGSVGIPVFANYTSGIAILLGVTGGFLLGYIPLAFFSGFFCAGKKTIPMMIMGMALGNIILYVSGTLWFMFFARMSLWSSLLACVFPFLPGDCLKIAAACAIAMRLSPVLDRHFAR